MLNINTPDLKLHGRQPETLENGFQAACFDKSQNERPMKPLIRISAALTTTLLLAACANPSVDAQARRQTAAAKALWQGYLNELPAGASTTQIEEWQARHGVTLNYDTATASYSSTNLPDGRAEVNAQNRICDSYFLVLTLKMDGQNRLKEKDLSSLGSCI